MASGFHFALWLCVASGLLAAASVTSCPDGWTRFGSRCFKFHITAKTWMDAEKLCQSANGNLASIHSAEENTFLNDFIEDVSGTSRRTWIGATDAVQEKTLQWADGSPVQFTRWHTGQPDNFKGKEHCVEMNWHGNFWNDLSCITKLSFVCSKNL
ncbi:galactose-specific lectin nattectin-like [Centropristis striata]|uniref:galactose-specific lectin nattectin-like n=1 Tax=Centropristis striata TaxID=184440 RepID=UPI0027E1BA02|nr:galactose-specific lectin nattectin-like [Centropristis striata]